MINKNGLFLILIFFSFQAPAQIYWGLKGGANVSTLGTSSGSKPRLGYHLGTYYSQHLEEQYGWQIGLQYSLQGSRVENGANGRLRYNYLSMPILMKLYFAESTYAEIGPQIAYLMSAKYKETGFEEDKTSSVKRWDFLAMGGIGHETEWGGNAGLRFGFGFTNTSGATVGSSTVFRNLLLQLYVSFNLKEIE